MAIVRNIIKDALFEIGVASTDGEPSAQQSSFALLRLQNQIDSWAADQLTLSVQLAQPFVWPDRIVTAGVILAGGAGYSVGNVLTVVGGTTTNGAATFTVATVAAGVITAVTLLTGGHYSSAPGTTATTTVAPAGGTGATLTLTLNAATTSTQTIGPGGNLNIQRPVWIDGINFINPGSGAFGSAQAVEVPMAPMDRDSYRLQTIKGLQSGLPQQFFYQTSLDTLLGTLFIWPQPTQGITLVLYAPQAVGVPASLNSILLGPPGYQEAFMYQLALRLCTPFGRPVPPLLPGMAAEAYARMKRPNLNPGLVGVDVALTPTAGGYNVLSDQQSSPGGR